MVTHGISALPFLSRSVCMCKCVSEPDHSLTCGTLRTFQGPPSDNSFDIFLEVVRAGGRRLDDAPLKHAGRPHRAIHNIKRASVTT